MVPVSMSWDVLSYESRAQPPCFDGDGCSGNPPNYVDNSGLGFVYWRSSCDRNDRYQIDKSAVAVLFR